LILKSYKNPIDLNDLWDLDDSDKSKNVAENFEKAWKAAIEK
jgi:hypothetical protein